MKNEFSDNDQANAAINTVYQSMYAKSDCGVKNGETTLTITTQSGSNPFELTNQIKQYFDRLYVSKTLKKYFISIDVQDQELHIIFKWGHHAIVANGKLLSLNTC